MQSTTRKHLTLGLLAAVAVMAVFAMLGHPLIDPAVLAGVGMLPMAMSGEIDMKEIKTLLDKQGEAWGEFTRKNDELLKAKAEGKAVSDLQTTVDKINGELSKFNADLVEIAKKANRPQADGKQLTPEQS
jgi:xanthosine utilization system XapX-like protein